MKPIIRVENLSKQYRIGATRKPYENLRETIMESVRSPLKNFRRNGDGSTANNQFWALRDINFTVEPGEVVGIIGRNGAGKSTLLKILSRITEPTAGKIELYGRVGSLLEVGTGFHQELTGRENIFLNGAILGMKREEIAKKFDEIIDFAEIEDFLDTAVKHYSSGMYTRLAFAVAANLDPEILIVDEVLAVGDAEFQKKCLGKMKSVSEKEGRTVLFVSHNMSAVRQLCKKGVFLSSGRIRYSGEIEDAVSEYLSSSSEKSSAYVREANAELDDSAKPVLFQKIWMRNANQLESYVFEVRDSIFIEFEILLRQTPLNSSLFLMILNQDKNPVCAYESDGIEKRMTLKVESEFLARGRYSIHAFLHTPRLTQFDVVFDKLSFEINDFNSRFIEHGAYNYGSVFGRGEWI